MDINEIRRINLQTVIDEHFNGVSRQLALALELNPSHISRLYTENENHRRNMGPKLARRIEEAANLPDGWMDQSHTDSADYKVPILEPHEIKQWVDCSVAEGATMMSVGFAPECYSDKTFAIKMLDSGMEPRICVGDIVIINPQQPPRLGSLIACDFNNDGHLTIGTYSAKGAERFLKLFNGDALPLSDDSITGSVAVVMFNGAK